MADFNGTFSGSIEALDYSGLSTYTGSTFGFLLHQRTGQPAEKVQASDFYTTFLESDPFPLYSSPSGGRDPGHYIIVRSGSDAIRVTPVKDFFGGYMERVSVPERRNSHIYAKGAGRGSDTTQPTWGVKVLTINGETVYDYWNGEGRDRGLTLTILSGSTHEVVSTTSYNTALGGAGVNAVNMAAAIDAMSPQEIGIITSLGYWETFINSTLKASAAKVGLSKLYGHTGTPSGSAYVAIFYGASGSSYPSTDAIERMVLSHPSTGSVDIPQATLSVRIQSNRQSALSHPAIDGAYSTNALWAPGGSTTIPSLYVENDGTVVGSFSGSISEAISASWAAFALSSSHAITASYAENAGVASSGSGTAGPFYPTASYWAANEDLQVTGSMGFNDYVIISGSSRTSNESLSVYGYHTTILAKTNTPSASVYIDFRDAVGTTTEGQFVKTFSGMTVTSSNLDYQDLIDDGWNFIRGSDTGSNWSTWKPNIRIANDGPAGIGGGKYLRILSSSAIQFGLEASGSRGYFTDQSDIVLLIRFNKISAGANYGAISMHKTYVDGNGNDAWSRGASPGFTAVGPDYGIRLWGFDNDVATTWASNTGSGFYFPTGSWIWFRTQMQRGASNNTSSVTFRARAWLYGASEPGTWTYEDTKADPTVVFGDQYDWDIPNKADNGATPETLDAGGAGFAMDGNNASTGYYYDIAYLGASNDVTNPVQAGASGVSLARARGLWGVDGDGFTGYQGGRFVVANWADSPISFHTNQKHRMTLGSDGTATEEDGGLLIGGPFNPESIAFPQAKLHISQSTVSSNYLKLDKQQGGTLLFITASGFSDQKNHTSAGFQKKLLLWDTSSGIIDYVNISVGTDGETYLLSYKSNPSNPATRWAWRKTSRLENVVWSTEGVGYRDDGAVDLDVYIGRKGVSGREAEMVWGRNAAADELWSFDVDMNSTTTSVFDFRVRSQSSAAATDYSLWTAYQNNGNPYITFNAPVSFSAGTSGSGISAESAATASFALTASYIDGLITFPNGLDVTGSITSTTSITASAYSGSIESASYATTASYSLNAAAVGSGGPFYQTSSFWAATGDLQLTGSWVHDRTTSTLSGYPYTNLITMRHTTASTGGPIGLGSYINTSHSIGTVNDMYGADFGAAIASDGNVGGLYGIETFVGIDAGAGTASTAAGIFIADPYNNGTGGFVNLYGILIGNQNEGISGSWAIKTGLGTVDLGDALWVSGSILPGATNTYNLGSSTQRWKDLYLSGSTIYFDNVAIREVASDTIAPTNAAGTQILNVSASFVGDGSGVTGVVSSSYAGTSSLLLGTIESASWCATASFLTGLIESSSYTVTASYSEKSTTADSATSSSYASTASLLLGSIQSASYALTASYAANAGAPSAGGPFYETGSYWSANENITISGSTIMTGSIPLRVYSKPDTSGDVFGWQFHEDISDYGSIYWLVNGTAYFAQQTDKDNYRIGVSTAKGGSINRTPFKINYLGPISIGNGATANSEINFSTDDEVEIYFKESGINRSRTQWYTSQSAGVPVSMYQNYYTRFGSGPRFQMGTLYEHGSPLRPEQWIVRYADTSSGTLTDGMSIDRAGNIRLNIGGSGWVNSTGAITASAFSGDGTAITGVISSSYAQTASLLLGSIVSASYALTSSWSETASYAANAGTPAAGGPFYETGSYWSATENIKISGSLDVSGSFTAFTKSFLIDHQGLPGKKLQYGVVEGPEHSVVYRGRLKDEYVIRLPDEWEWLVDEDTITVQLTPHGTYQKLYVLNISNNMVHVGIEGYGKIDCHYLVQGTRKDVPPLETVI